MSTLERRTSGILALVMIASIEGRTQPSATSDIVAQFYPQALVELAQRSGQPFDRNQCYAVFDTDGSGAPRTIVAAYTNDSTGVIRVLRANGSGSFDVVAEPQGYDFFGFRCKVALVDLNQDGRNNIFVSFTVMGSDVGWVFDWDGQQLINLTPVRANFDGTLKTDLIRPEIVDVDNDGVKEIYVNSQYPPPLDEPVEADILYRLTGDRYVEDRPLVGLWAFERRTSTPETSRTLVALPQGARGPYTLHVVNGAQGGQLRATSAQVWVNGEEILGPSDFGQNVAFIDRPVTLGAENELTVRFAGVPGSKMLIILKSDVWDAP